MKETAILMAAGLGTRMKPLTDQTPKPLIKVHDKPMIETVIEGLEFRGVSWIYVVAGYKKEQFAYLREKYKNLSIIENKEYQNKNNISSIYAVCGILGEASCFICEADLYISDQQIFQKELRRSCYYGKMVSGHSDDWVFEQDPQGRIIRVGKGGDNVYNMVGIAYLLKEDAKTLAELVKEAYQHQGHEQLFWDEIVDQNLDMLDLTVQSVEPEQIAEIDTVSELIEMDPKYIYLKTECC